MKKTFYLVLAGDQRQYETWRYFYKGLSDYKGSKYISEIEQLRGYTPKGSKIVLYGEYWKNKAYNHPGFTRYKDFYIVKFD